LGSAVGQEYDGDADVDCRLWCGKMVVSYCSLTAFVHRRPAELKRRRNTVNCYLSSTEKGVR
jgi:hypothetical protein